MYDPYEDSSTGELELPFTTALLIVILVFGLLFAAFSFIGWSVSMDETPAPIVTEAR